MTISTFPEGPVCSVSVISRTLAGAEQVKGLEMEALERLSTGPNFRHRSDRIRQAIVESQSHDFQISINSNENWKETFGFVCLLVSGPWHPWNVTQMSTLEILQNSKILAQNLKLIPVTLRKLRLRTNHELKFRKDPFPAKNNVPVVTAKFRSYRSFLMKNFDHFFTKVCQNHFEKPVSPKILAKISFSKPKTKFRSCLFTQTQNLPWHVLTATAVQHFNELFP